MIGSIGMTEAGIAMIMIPLLGHISTDTNEDLIRTLTESILMAGGITLVLQGSVTEEGRDIRKSGAEFVTEFDKFFEELEDLSWTKSFTTNG